MKIINLKLSTGEEIIAKVESENDNAYIVSNPRTLTIHQTVDGRMSAGFIPTMMLANETGISIDKRSVVMYNINIQKDYEDKYLESVSGLTLANTLRG